jgi:hypothetical protein
MPRSCPKRHGAGPGLGTIACLTGAALAVDGAVRNAPAVHRGAEDVLAAGTIGAAGLAAATVLVVITWAALRLGRRARQRQDEAPGLPEPGMTVPAPEPAVVPVPGRLPGRPLFTNGPVSRVTAVPKAPGVRPHGMTTIAVPGGVPGGGERS